VTHLAFSKKCRVSSSGRPRDEADFLKACENFGIRVSDAEARQFFTFLEQDTSTPGEFQYFARTPRELGFTEHRKLPTMKACYKAAKSKGFKIGSASFVWELLRSGVEIVPPGKACIVSTLPFETCGNNGNMHYYFPRTQTIRQDSGETQTMFRMIGGSLGLQCRLDFPILFFSHTVSLRAG
jgi:hypothetical protein